MSKETEKKDKKEEKDKLKHELKSNLIEVLNMKMGEETHDSFSEKADIELRTFENYLSGETLTLPDYVGVYKICTNLNISADELFGITKSHRNTISDEIIKNLQECPSEALPALLEIVRLYIQSHQEKLF